MKNLLSLLLPILLCVMNAKAQQGEKNFIDKNYIEVTGKSELQFIPDKIYIQVVLSEKDKKGVSITEQEQKMLERLKALGIDVQKEVQIKDLVANLYKGVFNRDVLLSKEYQIIVKDGKTAGKVFLALDDVGINNARIEKLESTKIEEYRKEVKLKAVLSAKEKAQLLTEAVGQKVGKALYIQEQYSTALPVYANTINYKERNDADAADLNFEKLKVEATFLRRFEIL